MSWFRLKKAFTLLEMLVVITIISLLASMVLVSFSKFKAKAAETQCLNNLKNLHGCIMLTGEDWLEGAIVNVRGYYWHPNNWENKWYWHPGWVNRVGITPAQSNVTSATKPATPGSPAPWRGAGAERSIRSGHLDMSAHPNPKIYLCPVFAQKVEERGVMDSVRSYAMNCMIDGKPYNSLAGDSQGLSRYLMFADMALTNRLGSPLTNTCSRSVFAGTDTAQGGDGVLEGKRFNNFYPVEAVGSYHSNGKANAVFMDGHIEQIYRSQTTNACIGRW